MNFSSVLFVDGAVALAVKQGAPRCAACNISPQNRFAHLLPFSFRLCGKFFPEFGRQYTRRAENAPKLWKNAADLLFFSFFLLIFTD